MSHHEERLLDDDGVRRTLEAMSSRVVDEKLDGSPVRLIGIRSRGLPIALRLAECLKKARGVEVPVGAVDITLYRDDLHQAARWPVLHGTEIPFEIDGADIVLVDDVLFTGRTVRAALNAICDLGRPSRVRLAVLVDRGFRELPIQADIVGLTLTTRREERVHARVKPVDPRDEVVKVDQPKRNDNG